MKIIFLKTYAGIHSFSSSMQIFFLPILLHQVQFIFVSSPNMNNLWLILLLHLALFAESLERVEIHSWGVASFYWWGYHSMRSFLWVVILENCIHCFVSLELDWNGAVTTTRDLFIIQSSAPLNCYDGRSAKLHIVAFPPLHNLCRSVDKNRTN